MFATKFRTALAVIRVTLGSIVRGKCRVVQLLVGMLVCAAGGLASAESASAYLRDFERVRFGTPTSSAPAGGRSFSCPSGKFLIGVGGGVPHGFTTRWTSLALNKLWIRSASQGVGEVAAVETDPEPLPWHMAAEGYCASFTLTPPSGAPGAAYIKAVEVVYNQSPMNGSDLKSVTAGCLGREAIGGGFGVDGSGGAYTANHVTVHSGLLLDGDNVDGYTADAQESDFSFRAWRLTVWAICADRSPGAGGLYVGNAITTLEHTSTTTSVDHGVMAPCPPGKRIIGGSGEILGATDTVAPPPEVVLNSSGPTSPGNATAWGASGIQEDPTSTPWRVRARAVCAPMVPRS